LPDGRATARAVTDDSPHAHLRAPPPARPRPNPCYHGPRRNFPQGEDAMANREQKKTREKKKPKSDKNKKPKHMPFGGNVVPGQSQDHPGFNPFAKKS
jgi:hypothetical protein